MNERIIVGKFGGTSMATAENIARSAEIVTAEKMRAVVVSAPGKRNPDDEKVTDLLYTCFSLHVQGKPFDQAFDQVATRFEDIGKDLQVHQNVISWLASVHKGITRNGKDWTAAQGEIGMARIFTEYMGGAFHDAKKLIHLRNDGQIDAITYELIQKQLKSTNVLHVIPGFYGRSTIGTIETFARGGSDITGAIIARGIHADEYQNWTDVDGVKAADPRVIFDAKSIPEMTFKEMRELSYRGASVLQMDAVLPVAQVGIPVIIRNTFNPSFSGTRIVAQRETLQAENVIGIAGREGFASVQISKSGMNTEKGVAGRILECFESHGVSFEHDPTGIDVMSVIADQGQLDGKTDEIMKDIRRKVAPDDIHVVRDIGLVCVVGQGMPAKSAEIFAKIATAFHDKSIKIGSITYPTQGNSIIIGVRSHDTKDAIRATYDALLRD